MTENKDRTPSCEYPDLNTIYQEASQNWRYFLDWRHNIMLRLFVIVGGLLVLCGWLYDKEYYKYLFLPFLLSSLSFFIAWLLDRRNLVVLKATKTLLAKLEKLSITGDGFYKTYPSSKMLAPSYAEVLSFVYLVGTVSFFTVFVYLLWKF